MFSLCIDNMGSLIIESIYRSRSMVVTPLMKGINVRLQIWGCCVTTGTLSLQNWESFSLAATDREKTGPVMRLKR